MTNRQREYLNKLNAFYFLNKAVEEHKDYEAFQVEFEEEEDARRKPCVSSYMFRTLNLD